MSIYGSENLIFLIIDNPGLAGRFRDLIIQSMTGIRDILDEEAGEKRKGFSFADDNCALLTPDMYELFGAPVLQAVFERYAPEPEDWRYQHSDSDMGHLVPILARFNLHGCNFGPNVTVRHIREHMPQTVIQGQLAPFTFSRNEEVNIVAEFLRDFDQAKESRGLNFTTAGSINNGSRLTGMRLIMAAIQRWGRY
jgi:uroporphyrinogen decarboxylase